MGYQRDIYESIRFYFERDKCHIKNAAETKRRIRMLANTTEVHDWRKELIDVRRWPNPGRKHVESLLERALNVRVSLWEKKDHTVILLKFPASTQELPQEVQDIYSQLGMSIKEVFAEVLLKKPKRGSSTLWSQLVRTAYKAYRETWLQIEKLLYLDHFHPDADQYFSAEFIVLRKKTARSVGRRQLLSEEQLSLKIRFRELLAECKNIHSIVKACVETNLSEPEIRKAVFTKIRGKRIDKEVLTRDGKAWHSIPYGRQSRVVRLHDPTSWRSHQLAIALLALERDRKYQTIEKKIAFTRQTTQHKHAKRN
jgi:hypothetical protein